MNIIITGGTGLIGRPLAARLVSDGHQVTILSRQPENARPLAGAAVVRWDGRSSNGWEEQAASAQVIINFAGANLGQKRWTRTQKERILTSRVWAGNAVVEAITKTALSSNPASKVLIQSSAIDYYGNPGDTELDEASPAGETFLSSVCKEWESSTKAVEDLGVRRVVIRSGLVLSLAGGALPRLLLPFRFFVGGPLGSGSQWYSWIHIDDEIDAIRFLITNDTTHGVYNLTSPDPVTNKAFARAVAGVSKSPSWLPTPAFALELLLGEMSSLVLGGQKVMPVRLQEAGYQFHYSALEEALKELIQKPALEKDSS